MRVSAAGNMPLQGLVKPPAKPVVMIQNDHPVNRVVFAACKIIAIWKRKELSEYDSNLGKNRRIMWCRSTKAQKSKQSVDGRRKIRASG